MVGFYEYVESRGGGNIKDLVGFIQKLVDDPSAYLDLTVDEKAELEKKLDAALSIFAVAPSN